MFLDLILPNYTDFRRYFTKLVILDVIPRKRDFRRYSWKIVILDVILPKYKFHAQRKNLAPKQMQTSRPNNEFEFLTSWISW